MEGTNARARMTGSCQPDVEKSAHKAANEQHQFRSLLGISKRGLLGHASHASSTHPIQLPFHSSSGTWHTTLALEILIRRMLALGTRELDARDFDLDDDEDVICQTQDTSRLQTRARVLCRWSNGFLRMPHSKLYRLPNRLATLP